MKDAAIIVGAVLAVVGLLLTFGPFVLLVLVGLGMMAWGCR